eukprot:2488905-Rhodomonas_salina.2
MRFCPTTHSTASAQRTTRTQQDDAKGKRGRKRSRKDGNEREGTRRAILHAVECSGVHQTDGREGVDVGQRAG